MKASDATKLAGAQLKPDSKLIQPFLQPVFEKVKEAAERGNFSVEIRWPYRHDARTPVQWSDSIKDGVEAALRELGYTVANNKRTESIGGYGGENVDSPYNTWTISWPKPVPPSHQPRPRVCDWCKGSGKDTSPDGKRQIHCGSCGGSGMTRPEKSC